MPKFKAICENCGKKRGKGEEFLRIGFVRGGKVKEKHTFCSLNCAKNWQEAEKQKVGEDLEAEIKEALEEQKKNGKKVEVSEEPKVKPVKEEIDVNKPKGPQVAIPELKKEGQYEAPKIQESYQGSGYFVAKKNIGAVKEILKDTIGSKEGHMEEVDKHVQVDAVTNKAYIINLPKETRDLLVEKGLIKDYIRSKRGQQYF
ncbi:hypothetical protein ACFLZX_01405 [Nanoarchaeota archaeon]